MSFGRLLLASFFGVILASVLLVLVLFFVFAGIVSSAAKEPAVKVPDGVILHLNLSRTFTERTAEDPFAELFANDLGVPSGLGLADVTSALRKGSKDARVLGLYIEGATPDASPATLEAIRRAVTEFRASGKFVITYSAVYSEGGLYVASAGDQVYVYPEGGVDWNGMAATPMFFKGALDKLGIEVEVIRVGTFKSFAEPFTEKKMSPANREQYQMLLGDLWETMVAQVAQSRSTSPEALRSVATSLELYGAEGVQRAIAAKLVDAAKYKDEVEKLLAEKQGKKEADEPELLSVEKYAKATKKSEYQDNRIAVVYAVGDIMMGGGSDLVTPSQMQKAIRKAREDKRVKAIVLRVNSPGGSALASDLIWREILLAREEKPVIASFGDVAASGGYYISAGCDQIVAEATTITGSIGVVGLLPYTGAMFENKLGITFDRVTTDPYADIANPNRRLSDLERKQLQAGTTDIYRDFVKKVVDGREGLDTYESVDAIGQGRVWSGKRAVELKLVDTLGGLDQALALAAEKAGIGDTYQVVEYPELKTTLEELMESFSDTRLALLRPFLTPQQWSFYRTLQLMDDPRHVYARVYPDVVIE